MEKTYLMEVVEDIFVESLERIEFIINNSDRIYEDSMNIVDVRQLDNFREALEFVYLFGHNKGILSEVKLDIIYKMLDRGYMNETMLDLEIHKMNLRKKLAV